MKKKMRKAFRKGRRSSMVLDFRTSNFVEICELFYWKIFFRKNIYTHKIWNKNYTKSKIRLFAFRNRENLEKYLRAEKLNYVKNPEEKTRLMGEALGYPDFAVKDFAEISAKKNPSKTRLNFKNYDFGFDGITFYIENLSKMQKWCEANRIPFDNSQISIFENDKKRWHELSKSEISEILNEEKIV